jgi:hypothetical protein
MASWHYEKDGQRQTAVSSAEIGTLIQSRAIDGRTLVWTPGFVDWTPLAQTELSSLLSSASVPPALPASRISNVLVWVLAIAPLIGLLLEGMVAGALAPSADMAEYAGALAVKTGQYWWVTLLLNVGLSVLDERRLKRAGVDTTRFGKVVFVVPVYLWKRAKALNQGPAYFWVWIGAFVLTLLAAT